MWLGMVTRHRGPQACQRPWRCWSACPVVSRTDGNRRLSKQGHQGAGSVLGQEIPGCSQSTRRQGHRDRGSRPRNREVRFWQWRPSQRCGSEGVYVLAVLPLGVSEDSLPGRAQRLRSGRAFTGDRYPGCTMDKWHWEPSQALLEVHSKQPWLGGVCFLGKEASEWRPQREMCGNQECRRPLPSSACATSLMDPEAESELQPPHWACRHKVMGVPAQPGALRRGPRVPAWPRLWP